MDVAQEALTKATVTENMLGQHERTCTERYGRIDQSTTEIKNSLNTLTATLNDGIRRIHDKREESEDHLNAKIEAIASTARLDAQRAQKAISGLKIWILTNGIVVLCGITGWFADHFFSGRTP